MSLEYSEPIHKNINSQHINNIKFMLKTLFLTTQDHNLTRIGLILNQKDSWTWIVQIKLKCLGRKSILDYLIALSKTFMDSTLISEMMLYSLETDRSGKLYDRIES